GFAGGPHFELSPRLGREVFLLGILLRRHPFLELASHPLPARYADDGDLNRPRGRFLNAIAAIGANRGSRGPRFVGGDERHHPAAEWLSFHGHLARNGPLGAAAR